MIKTAKARHVNVQAEPRTQLQKLLGQVLNDVRFTAKQSEVGMW